MLSPYYVAEQFFSVFVLNILLVGFLPSSLFYPSFLFVLSFDMIIIISLFVVDIFYSLWFLSSYLISLVRLQSFSLFPRSIINHLLFCYLIVHSSLVSLVCLIYGFLLFLCCLCVVILVASFFLYPHRIVFLQFYCLLYIDIGLKDCCYLKTNYASTLFVLFKIT